MIKQVKIMAREKPVQPYYVNAVNIGNLICAATAHQ